ncbi:ferredoxin-type protein NapF [Rhizobium sp. Root482]|uniref:ferredoxin-type protein NapF n=1 Tax=Rhizobium sp. Root482 TaxID=1736543 RepID=UPI0006F9BA75|nr:ferredoxin-type protein NapF [Rhizobium sp. Root482]KQY12851.1 ferredoxin-type protein NapF [Rhizobium sp. Root482]
MAEASLLSRRNILRGRIAPDPQRIRPPGVSRQGLEACTGCGDCVPACPTNIITILDGTPTVDFTGGECLFCGKCAEICPEPVFDRLVATAFPHRMAISESCLALHRTDCQSCRDNCPTGAIRFSPRLGGPFVPSLDPDLCNGCGACISVCPAAAIAITHPEGGAIHG